MQKDLKNVTAREARKTTVAVSVVLILASLVLWYRERMTAAGAAVTLAVLLLAIGAFMPGTAKLFHRGWMTIAFALGYVNSQIILTLVYFLVFVPYGVLSRIFGRDPLDVRSKPRDSYWHRRSKTRQEADGFERLF